MRALTLMMLLEALADHVGPGLLRLKGIVNIAERPNRPAVIHGVQHIFHAPTWLEKWPSADRSTRLVLIGRGLSGPWIDDLIAALDAELAELTISE
jgi:G3E family GTPase